MLLAACDYDGTLLRDGRVSARDLAAIGRWRAAGNAFGIVTGRGPATLLPALARRPVPCDFLACNNGALLLDGEGRVLQAVELPVPARLRLLAHPALGRAVRCACFTARGMRLLEGKAARWGHEPAPVPFVSPAAAAAMPGLVQVSLGFASRGEAFALGGLLRRDLAGEARVLCSLSLADVVAPGAGKEGGIALAARRFGWEPELVLTAGDDGNDHGMLAAFRGHAMAGAAPDVAEAAGGRVVEDVAAMLLPYLR